VRRVLLLAVLSALSLSACASQTRPGPPVNTRATTLPAPVQTDPAELDPAPGPEQTPYEDPQARALRDSWPATDPRGTMPQIALRFLRALQRGDDLAAERELSSPNRERLSFDDLWTLHRVMSDVRRNAGLSGSGGCTRVWQISTEAVVAVCGRRHVVVNLDPGDDLLPGVHLSDWTRHYDVFHGPHTHAYTTIDF
jgi:hypothetical protein